MSCENYFKKIDELNNYYLDVWEDICNIESPTKFKEGVDAVGAYFARLAEKREWKVEYSRQPLSGDVVCITMNSKSEAAPITLSAHMDTVQPVGSCGTPAVHRDEEKIYGPGVLDCKGGIVGAFLAMDALYSCGFLSRPIQLLLQSDEEGGSKASNKTTIKYICEKAKDSIAFLNLEGYTEGDACIQRKGILTFKFTVNGIEAHSSASATKGANAIAEAAHKILEIEKIKEPDGITCCCSIISGGTTANTVPGKCSFYVNIRFATGEQQKYISERMQEIADTVYIDGCKTDLELSSWRYAMEYNEKNARLLEIMNRSFEANSLPVLKPTIRKGGSDAADVTVYGIPCVDSIGVQGGGIHTAHEFAYLSSLAECAKRLVSVIDYMSV